MCPDSTKQPVNKDVETKPDHIIQLSHPSEKSSTSTRKRPLDPAQDSMHLGHNPFQIKDANNSKSVLSLQTLVNPELSSRWVKRLKNNFSSTVALNSETVNVGNGPHSVEIHNLFSRALKNKRLMNLFDEEVFVKEKQLPKAGRGSLEVSSKDMKCWIKRWSRNNSQVISDKERAETTMTDDREKSKADSEKFEARKSEYLSDFSGRECKSKIHSCEFQRRGTSVVWNS